MSLLRVLAVDDERKILDIVKYCLEQGGCSVQAFTDPAPALEMARREKFDVIVLDIVLANRDGYGIASELKKIKNAENTPILFVSSKIEVAELFLEHFSGPADFLAKPFKKEELLARVKALAEGKGRRERSVAGRRKSE